MPTLHLPLSLKLWHWHWNSPEDEEFGVPGVPILNSEVVEWLDANHIACRIALSDDLELRDMELDVTFESETDATAFKNEWLPS